MTSSADLERVRAVLRADRPWALYALGDLEPEHLPYCDWWLGERAVVLLYKRFERPVLIAVGLAEHVAPLLAQLPPHPLLHLHVQPAILRPLARHYDVPAPQPMIRMHLAPAAFRPREDERVVPLTAADAPALGALYDDGRETGEAPDFYTPAMIEGGYFFGIHENGELIAAAGTHLVGRVESVAAIGNVYTRRDHRGRGLGQATTSAVVTALLREDLRTIGLSVNASRLAAQQVYRKLGFAVHCDFVEGHAIARAR